MFVAPFYAVQLDASWAWLSEWQVSVGQLASENSTLAPPQPTDPEGYVYAVSFGTPLEEWCAVAKPCHAVRRRCWFRLRQPAKGAKPGTTSPEASARLAAPLLAASAHSDSLARQPANTPPPPVSSTEALHARLLCSYRVLRGAAVSRGAEEDSEAYPGGVFS
jgi:hypothetical protein